MGALSEQLSDEALIARLRDRDTVAFATLYDRHSRMAFGLAYRMIGDAPAAEDVVQDAFLALWRQAATFQADKAAARSWLLSIVHHRAVDYLRRAGPREISGTMLEGALEQADDRIDVEREVSASLAAAQIREALGALPREQRQALALAYFGGLSHNEIAQRLGVPAGTIKGRLRLGLQKMKAILDQDGAQKAYHDA
jgi:RNA polymerase sigma-70 factor (ECF subfamily)